MACNVTILDERASWLSGHSSNVHSQCGEDGLIAAALAQFGTVNRWCFEVGANDGLFYSNTKVLRDDGWDSVLIEGHAEHYAKLALLADVRTRCIHEMIGPNSLDRILGECGAPCDLDFGCIDIDNQDYWAWDGMKFYRPRLMLVEYEPSETQYIPDFGATTGQATFDPIVKLGRHKGYTPIAQTQVNVLFVREDLWPN